jgi:hypothetical protein
MARGVQLTYGEAVAIAQELITYVPTDAYPIAPAAPPSLDNVRIAGDGSVQCLGCDAAPGVREVATILEQLLLRGGSRVPGGLRYTIARALLEVDAPPFESIDALSAALARYESGDSADVVRGLYARALPSAANVVEQQVDRRRRVATTAALRRQLRQADEALFYQTYGHAVAVTGPQPVPDAAIVGSQFTPKVPAANPTPEVPAANPTPEVPTASHRRQADWLVAGVMALLIAFGTGYVIFSRMPAAGGRTMSRAASPASDVPTPVVRSRAPSAGVAPARPVQPAAPARSKPLEPPTPSAPPTRVAPARTAAVVRAVSASNGATFSPTFESNGTALFFHSGKSSDPHSSLEAAQLDADNLRVMTILDDGAKNYHVRPSPDGAQLAFDSDRDGERGVYVANRDGSEVHRVSGPGFAAVPSWSPDGATLAFVRAETDRPHVWNLWLQRLDGGSSRRLTSFRFGQTWSASWFPDGRRICFTHEDRLIVLDLTSGATREYASPVPHALARTPAVSPDGKRVVFQVARSGAWLLDLDNGSMRCVLTDPTAEEFAWSPDGMRVAFHSRRDGQWGIWLMTTT